MKIIELWNKATMSIGLWLIGERTTPYEEIVIKELNSKNRYIEAVEAERRFLEDEINKMDVKYMQLKKRYRKLVKK